MSINRTLTAAQAESFEVVGANDVVSDGGFLVSEAHLNNIETALEQSEGTVATLTTERDNAIAAEQSANTRAQAATDLVATRDARITVLESEVADLKKGPAAGFSKTTAKEDTAGNQGGKPFHESASNPFNALADSLLGKPKA